MSSNAPRVAVVDDEPRLAKVLGMLLRREGYEVSVFDDSRAFVAALAESTFDLVLTDLKMPGMSGMQLASAIGAQNPKLRVLFITGFAGEADVDAVGVTARPAVLQKPISGEGLLDAVRGLLQQPVSPRAEQP